MLSKMKVEKKEIYVKSAMCDNRLEAGLPLFLQHQHLVDLMIVCGGYSIQIHKVVLYNISPTFKEESEKNTEIRQIIIPGCNFEAVKRLIEYIYAGHTLIEENILKHFVALYRYFGINTLESVTKFVSKDELYVLCKPKYLTDEPKFPISTKDPVPTAKQKASKTSSTIVTGASTNTSAANVSTTNVSVTKAATTKATVTKVTAPQKNSFPDVKYLACAQEAARSNFIINKLNQEIAADPNKGRFLVQEGGIEIIIGNYVSNEKGILQKVDDHDVNDEGTEINYQLAMPDVFDDFGDKGHVIVNRLPNNTEYVDITDVVLNDFNEKDLSFKMITPKQDQGTEKGKELKNVSNDDICKPSASTDKPTPAFNIFIPSDVFERNETNSTCPIENVEFINWPSDVPNNSNTVQESFEFCPDIFFANTPNPVSVPNPEPKDDDATDYIHL